MGLVYKWESWRIRRLAAGRPIEKGEWLLDLGMPTPRAVRIYAAYEMQQRRIKDGE